MSVQHLAAVGGELELEGSNYTLVVVVALIALAALAVAAVLVREVLAADEGTEKMQEIAGAVQEGAAAYLTRQFRTLAVFAVLVFFLLFLLPAETGSERIGRSIFFLVGAVFSALIGYIGMWLAVRGNVGSPRPRAPRVSSTRCGSRSAPGASSACSPSASACSVPRSSCWSTRARRPKVLEGFGFGAALLAMFMRVGGGIFTKAADVGADLVGKVEQGIPEDDPRNAATIADNVGDNVGDCAGMAADLFESYAVTLVAALILGQAAFGVEGLVFPLIVPAIGVLTAVIGIFAVSPRAGDRSGMTAINRGFFISAVISAVLVAIAAYAYLPGTIGELTGINPASPDLVDVARQGPAHLRDRRRDHRHRAGRGDPAADRVLHRDQPAPGRRRRQVLAHRAGDGDPRPASRSASSRRSTPRCSSAPPSTARSCWAAARSCCRCSRSRWPAPAC